MQLEKTYERSSRRLVHGALQMLAGCCALAGYLIAFVSNESPDPGDQFAIGSGSTTAMHVWLGYITLLAVFAQCILGMYKMVLKARDDAATCAPWHGTVGPVIFLLGCVTACFGCGIWFTDDDNNVTGQGAGLIVGILIVMVLVLVQLCACPAPSTTEAGKKTDDSARAGGVYATI
jgi:cytochrome b561